MHTESDGLLTVTFRTNVYANSLGDQSVETTMNAHHEENIDDLGGVIVTPFLVNADEVVGFERGFSINVRLGVAYRLEQSPR